MFEGSRLYIYNYMVTSADDSKSLLLLTLPSECSTCGLFRAGEGMVGWGWGEVGGGAGPGG